jgi:hypothetical protein
MNSVTKGIRNYLLVSSASLWLVAANLGVAAQTICYIDHLLVTVLFVGLTLIDSTASRVTYLGIKAD